jgi:transcriptional regulator with XRE-family HTH domain
MQGGKVLMSAVSMAGGVDMDVRKRISAWMRYYWRERAGRPGYERQEDYAEKLGISDSTLSLYMSGKRTPGLDTVIKMHRVLGISLDMLIDVDPDDEKERSGERTPNPEQASPGTAHPGRRGGGRV